MKIHELSPAQGSRKKCKRIGRGPGSGLGKTSGRGHKGQKARSGGKVRPGFEGGQMPLHRRLPKRGFTNIFKKQYTLIHLKDLSHFDANTTLDVATLRQAGLIKKLKHDVKLLGDGDIEHPLVIKVHKATRSAREKVEAVGGRVELL